MQIKQSLNRAISKAVHEAMDNQIIYGVPTITDAEVLALTLRVKRANAYRNGGPFTRAFLGFTQAVEWEKMKQQDAA